MWPNPQEICSSNGNSNWNNNCSKYTRTPAITLSMTRIRTITTSESATARIRAIATSESATATPLTATTKTTAAIVTMMTTLTAIIAKTMTKTITRVVETLSTLTMILVTDPARNQIVIYPDLETLYLQSNLST